MPDYQFLDGIDHWMYHVARQQPYEKNCDGCLKPLPGELKWNETNQCYMFGAMMVGPFIAVITDRSGSENGTAHNDETCIEQAMTNLDDENYVLRKES